MSIRWITGHFTHISWSHFALNIIGLLSIWMIYGRVVNTRGWFAFFLICLFGISLGFSLLSPQTGYYLGLSGVLHGMLSMAVSLVLLEPARRQNLAFGAESTWEEIAVLLGLWGKIIYEQTVGAVPLTASLTGGAVIVNAHLYGAVIGIGFACAIAGYGFINNKVYLHINEPPAK